MKLLLVPEAAGAAEVQVRVAARLLDALVEDAPDVVRVLLPDGQVESELLLEDFVALGCHAVLPRHRKDGVDRKQADESERGNRDPDHGRDNQYKFVEDEP